MQTATAPRNELALKVRALPTRTLLTSLVMADADLDCAIPGSDDARAKMLVRVALIGEVESRFPAALAAVEMACDEVAADETFDYVAVLLSAVGGVDHGQHVGQAK